MKLETKISGFTICRNSIRLSFPFRESIRSLAAFCDEIVVAVGDSDDGTREALVELGCELPCELKLVDSAWDLSSVKGGLELSRQTNIALDACAHNICFYLQSDEVLHEEDAEQTRLALRALEKSTEASSLAFTWLHFFGDPDTIIYSRRWYRREIRAIKKSSGLRSYGDAQGFRKYSEEKWTKLPTLLTSARVFHYGWVRPEELMALKVNDFQQWWHGKKGDYAEKSMFRPQYGIRPFRGTHPNLMQMYLQNLLKVSRALHEISAAPLNADSLKSLLADICERSTGWRPGEFKNYSRIVS